MKTLNLRNSINRSPLRSGLLFIALALGCFALLSAPNAFGVVPAPDGGYPGFNTAEGQNALLHLTTGTANTAVGWVSLQSVTTGSFNTGVGAGTLVLNSGSENTATGAAALLSNTTGVDNTANGAFALFSNTQGFENTAIGYQALFSNTTGRSNTAIGDYPLLSNTTGSFNTAIGNAALLDTTGSGNVALGSGAGSNVTTADNVICIGSGGQNVSNSCFIGQIFGATSSSGTAVFINSAGRLGTTTSSRRFKEEIKPMQQASEALFALKPVTFRYKKEIDADQTPQFGLIAEDVAKVSPDLVLREPDGKVYTVRYEVVNAMLLNEFLKAHRRIEEQDKRIDQLTAQLKEQASLIQKVNDKVELNRPALQTVANDQ